MNAVFDLSLPTSWDELTDRQLLLVFTLLRRNGLTSPELKANYPYTQFYTSHCTGDQIFGMVKDVMGEQLHSFRCGTIYDDNFHDDLNVGEEMKIEYYD